MIELHGCNFGVCFVGKQAIWTWLHGYGNGAEDIKEVPLVFDCDGIVRFSLGWVVFFNAFSLHWLN